MHQTCQIGIKPELLNLFDTEVNISAAIIIIIIIIIIIVDFYSMFLCLLYICNNDNFICCFYANKTLC